MKIIRLSALLATAALAAQPCFAAEDLRDMGSSERRGGAFAGVSAKIPFGQRQAKAPSARLSIGMTQTVRTPGAGGSVQSFRGSAFELGLARDGGAELFIGGRSHREIEQRLGLRGSTGKVLLVVGALAAAAVVGILVFGEDSSACIPEDPDCG